MVKINKEDYVVRVRVNDIQSIRDDLIGLSSLAESVSEEAQNSGAFPFGSQLYLSRALSRIAATLSGLIGEYEHGELPF